MTDKQPCLRFQAAKTYTVYPACITVYPAACITVSAPPRSPPLQGRTRLYQQSAIWLKAHAVPAGRQKQRQVSVVAGQDAAGVRSAGLLHIGLQPQLFKAAGEWGGRQEAQAEHCSVPAWPPGVGIAHLTCA